MTDAPEILRYAAFADDASGGNPAGVVLDAAGLDDETMQRIAAEADDAETAFITGMADDGARRVRYFSPIAEVPFSGHATVATAIAIAEREGPGTLRFETPVGEIVIETTAAPDRPNELRAAFTSVEPAVEPIPEFVLEGLLVLLGLDRTELDERFPPRLAFAGNWHPVLVVAALEAFDGFSADPGAVRAFMDTQDWKATITVLHPLGDGDGDGGSGSDTAQPARFEARNLLPVGRITEDPATGAAAAAVGGYLRALGLVNPPARVVIEQGRHVGRPGELTTDIPEHGGIVVSGRAVPIT
ncbi:PhzF family phenazine biosynthesis protein [Agromyces ramosus]|uniref:PhzF family phenazine biosynthesis protein n=1 Tax=Agromyces ramosus TaxID=33879 RepID=A0ABU0R5M5_9MICO|nr:PhzF family phenazine biosynthesis isomerase [Agromyces ramosus]MDQ0893386.1 PhzF family phenazine biosynthesis protein [Agromyces ramosus]